MSRHKLKKLEAQSKELKMKTVPLGAGVDQYGQHYGICKNRAGLWGFRHDTVEAAIIRQARTARARATSTRGKGNLFGAPASGPGGYKRADIVAYNYYGPGKHLFLDVAVTASDSPTALKGGSADTTGAAARKRAAVKDAKYITLAARCGGKFKPAVIERQGAFDDAFAGVVKLLTGDGERDPLQADDYCFSTSSRTTYAAADIGLSAVIADAYMVSLLAEHDVHGRPLGGGADSETPSNPSHAARAHASRRENDKLAPLWYECPGLVQA